MADSTEVNQIEQVERRPRPTRTVMAVAAMVVVAAVLYSWHLRSDLYADEGHTYQVVATGSFIEHLKNPMMVHPPLYFLTVRIAHQWVGRPWAIRLPSLVFALATIVLVAVGANRILGRRYVLPAAAVAASSPFLLDFAAEGRPYALLCLLSISMLIALYEFLRVENAKTTALLTIVSVMGLATHLAFVFTLIFAAIYYLAVRRKITKHALIPVGAVVVVAGLLLMLMLDDIRFSDETTAMVRDSYLSIPNFVARLPVALTYGYNTFTLSEIGPGRNVWLSMVPGNWPMLALVLVSFVGLLVATVGALIKRTRHVGFLVLFVVVPIVVAMIVGTIGFYYLREKYLAGVLGGYLLLIALAGVRLASRKIGWVPIAAYVVIVAVSIVHYIAWPNEYSRRMDMTGLNVAIGERIRQGDSVVLYRGYDPRGSIDTERLPYVVGYSNLHAIHRSRSESVSPGRRAGQIDADTSGTIFLVSLEAARNFVDPEGEVLETFRRSRTVQANRFGRNLILYVLTRKASGPDEPQ